MPIDYSKFDSIDDSDDDGASAQKRPRNELSAPAGSAPRGAAAPFAPPVRRGRGGNEQLEPEGVDKRLQIVPQGDSEMDRLASQLEKMGVAPGADRADQEQPKPRKANEPQRMCMRSDGRKKIHTTYPDGSEMVEEFDEKTEVLMLRKVRKAATIGSKEPEWIFEVGQAPEAAFDPHQDIMRASVSNPIFLRKDTPEHFQWRIRNLSYPADVYSVTIDHEKQEIVVRTTNKKYFKRIGVPDLGRLGLKMQDNSLSWKHQHNTLIVSYTRPQEVHEAEQQALKEADRSAVRL